MAHELPVTAVALLLVGILVAVPAAAQETEAPHETEVQGVLINQTRSVAGQAFYAGFFTVWMARDPDGLYSLVISEKPFPQNAGASRILISYDNNVILNTVIKFNAGKARAAGEAATEYAFNRIVEMEMAREFGNPDMAVSGY